MSELMKQADPEAYNKFIAEIAAGNDGLTELIQFAKKAQKHPEWKKQYVENNAEVVKYLQNLKLDNRFEQADYSSRESFQQSLLSKLGETVAADSMNYYIRNLQYFMGLLAD